MNDIPVDLDQAASHAQRLRRLALRAVTEVRLGGQDLAAFRELMDDLPRMLTELRYARADLERWRALHPMGRQYTLTDDGRPPNGWKVATPPTISLEQADAAAAEREQGRGPTPWVQATYQSSWTEHTGPPF